MELIEKLRMDYPNFGFEPSDTFYWSPKNKTVYYDKSLQVTAAKWSLLHELAHGILGHASYYSDFELLKLEVEAWEEAKRLAEQYGLKIPEDRIQDCLDTYRDWLHARATCPNCHSRGAQTTDKQYECTSCGDKWQVSSARFCRPYRRKINKEPLTK